MNLSNITINEYLELKGVPFRESGNELIAKCLFNDCDRDSNGSEAHLYFNKETGQYNCKKCDAKGNLQTLKKHFGDFTPPTRSLVARQYFTQSLVIECANNIPQRIRTYLNGRGISDEIIAQRCIGFGPFYGTDWITIPIKKQGEVEFSFFVLRKDPENTDEKLPKNLFYPKGKSETTLYGEYATETEDLTITEGVMDCLSLLSLGYKSIFSTGGCMTFKEEWLDEPLLKAKSIYVAYDRDDAGEKGAEKVLKMLKKSGHKQLHKITLPEVVGDKGDVNDYIAKHKLPAEDLYNKYAESYPKRIDPRQFTEMTLDALEQILGMTIKGDRENKIITFLCQLSAFTKENQFNIMFNSPSATGKSYTAIEVSKLFPKDSLMKLGRCSATAFYHDSGKYNKETNTITVDLSNKIIIFTENQHYQLLEQLRSFLSHDEKIMNVKVTDKGQKGGNKTKNVELIGYASVVFCTAFLKSDEQEKTRFIILSPEITDEKIIAGIQRVIEKEKGGSKDFEILEQNPERRLLKLRIEAIRDAGVQNIYISNDDSEYLRQKFQETVGIPQARHQRDIQRLVCLVKSIALLNLWFRHFDGENITVARADIDNAIQLYKKIAVTQSLGISPYLHKLFLEVITPCYREKLKEDFGEEMGIRYQDILNYHFKVKKCKLDYNYLRQQIMPEFEACGLVERNFNGNRTSFSLPNFVPMSEETAGEDVGGVKTEKEDETDTTNKEIGF